MYGKADIFISKCHVLGVSLKKFRLPTILKTPTRQLSLGQRMRCEIAASLLHSPKILFLDEPTIGLDAVSKIAVREFVKQLNREQGTTVILTTHAFWRFGVRHYKSNGS